jgi:hypothetical protein
MPARNDDVVDAAASVVIVVSSIDAADAAVVIVFIVIVAAFTVDAIVFVELIRRHVEVECDPTDAIIVERIEVLIVDGNRTEEGQRQLRTLRRAVVCSRADSRNVALCESPVQQ